jgi:hypothetical protein
MAFAGSYNPGSCTAGTGGTFSCGGIQTQQPVTYLTSTGSGNVNLSLVFTAINGTMNGVSSMSMSTTATIQSCGSGIECMLFSFFAGSLPCDIELDISASLY